MFSVLPHSIDKLLNNTFKADLSLSGDRHNRTYKKGGAIDEFIIELSDVEKDLDKKFPKK